MASAAHLPAASGDGTDEGGHRRHFLRLPFRLRLGLTGVVITLGAALLLPLVVSGAFAMSPTAILAPPSLHFPMGADAYGRSVLSRVLLGMRVSYAIGLSVSLATLFIGGCVGLLTGYFPVADAIVMRFVDAIMSVPSVMIALATATVFGASVINTIVVLSLFYAPRTARVMRSAVFAVRETAFVEAARALGGRTARILWRHVVPNTISPLIIQQTFIMAYAILGEAVFSYIGVGVPPPTPSLGNILSEAQQVIYQDPGLSVFPGACIAAIVISVNLVGDGIRDLFDVHVRDL
ncbi:MAG TPA: ABC transporter permease [bacterium]|nr:ABC transporter permease [bacterium]